MKIAKVMGKRPVEDFLVRLADDLQTAMSVIDENGKGVAIVVDQSQHFKAVISDGDLRRWLLAVGDLSLSVSDYLGHPQNQRREGALCIDEGTEREQVLSILADSGARFAPVLNTEGAVVDVEVLIDLVQGQSKPIEAVVMAGGRGSRLSPYTDPIPKPMLPVQGKPILERVLESLSQTGINNVSITTHYLREKIVEHFGSGEKLGLQINYIDEEKPLGTAGALGALPTGEGPVLVMNGDIVSDINIPAMKRFHEEANAHITVAAHRYKVEIPYGVAICDGIDLQEVDEKPTYQYYVNAGIYLIERECLALIPDGKRFDMPDLLKAVKLSKLRTVVYPFNEKWLDVGRHDDYRRAQFVDPKSSTASKTNDPATDSLTELLPSPDMLKTVVFGGSGMIGSALLELLNATGGKTLAPSHSELDIADMGRVTEFLQDNKPDCIFMLAGKTGSMSEVREKPLDYLTSNLNQQMALLEAAHAAGVKRLIMTSSAAVYPEHAELPLREEQLLSGKCNGAIEAYGLAKAMGTKLCEYYQRQHGRMYTAAVLANIYGSVQKQEFQFLPSLLRRLQDATKEKQPAVTVWGSGAATRDFLHIDDCAEALMHIARYFNGSVINVASGRETSIAKAAETACNVTRFEGAIEYDPTKPEGVPRSCLDISILKSLGWSPKLSLHEGLTKMWANVNTSKT